MISPDGRRVALHTGVSGTLFTIDDKGVAGPIEEIPGPAEGVMFFPIAWSGDGRLLFGSSMRLKDHESIGLLVYDPETKKLSEPIPGSKTLGRAQRGTSLGRRFLYRDTDGIHVVDPVAHTDRVAVVHPPGGTYINLACRNTTCFLVRASSSADIWMRTEADGKKP